MIDSHFWQFTKADETAEEVAEGRHHAWYFNVDRSPDAGSFLVRVRIPAGGMHDFHIHPEMHEILYILQGKAEQWVEAEKQILLPGDAVYIDAAVAHATINCGDEPLEFLAILSPAAGWDEGTIDVSKNEPYNTYRQT